MNTQLTYNQELQLTQHKEMLDAVAKWAIAEADYMKYKHAAQKRRMLDAKRKVKSLAKQQIEHMKNLQQTLF